MKIILCPTDFSGNAANAVKYAAALASQVRGKLVLVHIVEAEEISGPEGAITFLPPDPRLQIYYKEKLQELLDQIQLEYGFLFELDTICESGSLPEQLNGIIRREQIDLVVMGTKGAKNFIDKVLGTNTAHFIKLADCPVLVIPENAIYKGIYSIAYATDLKTEETGILHQLLLFAQAFTPALYLVHVKYKEQPEAIIDNRILEELQKQYPDNTIRKVQLPGTDVITAIRQYVHENSIDILAVSIQHRSFWKDFLHKSITRQLTLTSSFPILALPTLPYQH